MTSPTNTTPVTLDILGEWWDSYLYSGSLYLVTLDGDVLVLPWNEIVDQLVGDPIDKLGFELSFVDARYLYGDAWRRLVRDPEIGALITQKINRIAHLELEIDNKTARHYGTPYSRVLPEAINDLEFHTSTIYTAAEGGLETINRHSLGGSRRKHWEGTPTRLRAHNGGLLAFTAGPDGLLKAPLSNLRYGLRLDPWQVLTGDFVGCSWLSTSIFASSYVNTGMLAVFTRSSERRRNGPRLEHRRLEAAVSDQSLFDPDERVRIDKTLRDRAKARAARVSAHEEVEIISTEEPAGEHTGARTMFDSAYAAPPQAPAAATPGFSWAGDGRICRVSDGEVSILTYDAKRDRYRDRIHELPDRKLSERSGEVIAGDVAPFGVIVETTDDLHVLTQDGMWRAGFPPVRWRTYPRSTNYPNQLHIVGEDRLRVVSFTNEDMREFAAKRSGAPIGRTRRTV
jgi:hypothetical protein